MDKPKRPEILVVSGDLAGKRFKVGDGVLRLGRSSSNDIEIHDEELSRNHCIFEPVGEDGIKLTDLASANGTYLNGREVTRAEDLKAGDVIRVGATTLKIVGEGKPRLGVPKPDVDLGLGAAGANPPPKNEGAKGSAFSKVLWAVVILLLVGAAVLFFVDPVSRFGAAEQVRQESSAASVRSFVYEMVKADLNGIYRYELRLGEDGELKVAVDDVPKENRHFSKGQVISDKSRNELSEILSLDALSRFDSEYLGPEPVPQALRSYSLEVRYSGNGRGTCKSVTIVNNSEPDGFSDLREKLEAFSKNELGIWAMQYSRDELVEMAKDCINLGNIRWEDRDVKISNLFESAKAFRDAAFYLETVNPKPDCYGEIERGLRRTEEELEARYKDRRFAANQAINLSRWEDARNELRLLMELIPDREDERYREASSKLMDVERRLKKGDR